MYTVIGVHLKRLLIRENMEWKWVFTSMRNGNGQSYLGNTKENHVSVLCSGTTHFACSGNVIIGDNNPLNALLHKYWYGSFREHHLSWEETCNQATIFIMESGTISSNQVRL